MKIVSRDLSQRLHVLCSKLLALCIKMPNAHIRYWFEWEFHTGTAQAILVIETSLELDPGKQAYNAGAVSDLITAVSTDGNTSVDHVRVIPVKHRT